MGTAAQEKRRAVLEALAPRVPSNLERSCRHSLEDLGQGIPGSGQARALQNLMLEQGEKRRPGLPLSPHLQGEESLKGLGLGGGSWWCRGWSRPPGTRDGANGGGECGEDLPEFPQG